MIKIGLVDIDVSHPLTFTKKMLENDIPMRYTYLCNKGFRGNDQVESFAKKYDIQIVDEIEDMVEHVDVGFIQSCNWDKHISYAMPFLEKGVPVFLDKPMVGSMEDIRKVRQLAANGAKILGSSSVRYAYEIRDFLAKPEEERGEILNIFGTSGVDEFNYGIHVVEALSAIAGAKGKSCKFVGRSKKVENMECETFFITFENGITATYNTFLNHWHPFDITIMTTKGTFSFEIDTNLIYTALLQNIYEELANHRNTIADVETITDSCMIMLAGKKSRDTGCGEVLLSELSDESFDGYAFEEEYAAHDNKMYLNL